MDDCCRLVLPYNAVHSIQQTKQIPNDPPQMGAKSTTTSNHPSTPEKVNKERDIELINTKSLLKEQLENAAIQNNKLQDLQQQLCEAELAVKKQQNPKYRMTEHNHFRGQTQLQDSSTR